MVDVFIVIHFFFTIWGFTFHFVWTFFSVRLDLDIGALLWNIIIIILIFHPVFHNLALFQAILK